MDSNAWIVLAAGLILAQPAHGEDKPRYAPAAAWVKPVPIPALAATAQDIPVQYLLADVQENLGPDGDKTYSEYAVRANSAQALQALGAYSQVWNPQTDRLIIHKVRIVRGGAVIDVLANKTFSIIQRESNLERAMLDGDLTANLQIEGLQIGDVLDVAVTLERRDPV